MEEREKEKGEEADKEKADGGRELTEQGRNEE